MLSKGFGGLPTRLQRLLVSWGWQPPRGGTLQSWPWVSHGPGSRLGQRIRVACQWQDEGRWQQPGKGHHESACCSMQPATHVSCIVSSASQQASRVYTNHLYGAELACLTKNGIGRERTTGDSIATFLVYMACPCAFHVSRTPRNVSGESVSCYLMPCQAMSPWFFPPLCQSGDSSQVTIPSSLVLRVIAISSRPSLPPPERREWEERYTFRFRV